MKNILILMLSMGMLWGCKSTPESAPWFGPHEAQHTCVQTLTDVIVYDIITPPVASRMYAYCNLAYYEALRAGNSQAASLIARMKGFEKLTSPDTGLQHNYTYSAATAFLAVAEALVFSKDSIRAAQTKLDKHFSDLESDVKQRSKAWGEAVAKVVIARSQQDNYKRTRGMPRYSVFKEEGKWLQTPPDYADAVEPNWRMLAPLLMDSAGQCKPPPPYAYSKVSGSDYYQQVKEVFEVRKQLTPLQDSIAWYWDDNPFVTTHKGHLTFASKKTTPVGHWMGITGILCRQYTPQAELNIAKAYALTSAAIYDGFISCWNEKYSSRTVRPITVIRDWWAPEWNSLLQTPPFPEYTSGHSVISSAAATVLHSLFGEVPFTDTTEMPYLGVQRSFSSALAAADEAGISRLYGGIHFRQALDEGKKQGQRVGALFVALNQ